MTPPPPALPLLPVPRPACTVPHARVSLANLRHNVSVIRGSLTSGTRLCAVLKADAYGHGAPVLARELCGVGARRRPLVDAVAVATLDEADAIGRISVPLFVLRPIESYSFHHARKQLEAGVRAGWVLTVNCVQTIKDIGRVARSMGLPALVQVALDTGMSRAGAPLHDLESIVLEIARQEGVKLIAMCTHFVSAEDAGHPATTEQLEQFRRATLPHVLAHPDLIRHASNSGGVFFHPQSHLDMVRPGKSLYGTDPAGGPVAGRDLRPILKWTAPLMLVRNLKKGTSIGYGCTYTADRDLRVGLVPVGFADGYSRSFSNRATTLIAGHPAPVVGRISMDYTTIDLSNVPSPNVGDEVTLIDDNPHSPASIYALAKLAETIPSEITTGLGNRIKRVATGHQIEVDILPTSSKSRTTLRAG